MMFADVDDPNQTMESIISKLIDDDDPEFGGIDTWNAFLDKINELAQKSSGRGANEISVLSWRKFKRIINKAIKTDPMFANRVEEKQAECRLATELKSIARSMGVILFGAEQFRSNIHARVTGNCATHAYGRTNSIETTAADYRNLPQTYKNMLTRLEQGEYLIQNPIFRSLLKIRFPKPISEADLQTIQRLGGRKWKNIISAKTFWRH